MSKLIITVAPTGSLPTKKMNPHVPITPEEIIETGVRCERLGASIIHVHARNPVDESPSTDFAIFENPHCFSAWLAGGGIRGGTSHGASDDVGYKAVVDPVHVNDLHATILHLLGMDHTKLTYRHNGRDYRLTDVAGQVIKSILA